MDCAQTQMNRPVGELTVAIVSDEPEFVRALMNRWQAERLVPAFTVVGPVANAVPAPAATGEQAPPWLSGCELVVLGGVPSGTVPQLQRVLCQPSRPVICVVAPADYRQLRESAPQLLLVPREDCWEAAVVVLAGECLRRTQAMLRAERAEQLLVAAQRHAALGKYALEMRHSINNSLTSVLGNSELMLMNDAGLAAEVRVQVEMIRNNALRLHEVMRRLWSLESEMRAVEDASEEMELRESAAAGKK